MHPILSGDTATSRRTAELGIRILSLLYVQILARGKSTSVMGENELGRPMPEAEDRSHLDRTGQSNLTATPGHTRPVRIHFSHPPPHPPPSNAKKSKRRRRMDRRSTSSESDGLLGLLKAENERRAKHDADVAQSLVTFVKESGEQKMQLTSLLKDLIASNNA
ncbi:hypothetical protein B0H14DRAFT_2590036 [Mycena olivaceomarginata]|nr:hypothetical protein B0H14DRAFT_2590036 [Mycena olivaceomarginata]